MQNPSSCAVSGPPGPPVTSISYSALRPTELGFGALCWGGGDMVLAVRGSLLWPLRKLEGVLKAQPAAALALAGGTGLRSLLPRCGRPLPRRSGGRSAPRTTRDNRPSHGAVPHKPAPARVGTAPGGCPPARARCSAPDPADQRTAPAVRSRR